MKSLNAMVSDGQGSRTYQPRLNRTLEPEVFATTGFFSPTKQEVKNWGHATPEAARVIANALNIYFGGGFELAEPERGYGGMGTFLGRPLFGYVQWSVPKQIIRCPDGETCAAGTIGYILGNEAGYGSTGDRDNAILGLLGDVDPHTTGSISEAILTALGE